MKQTWDERAAAAAKRKYRPGEVWSVHVERGMELTFIRDGLQHVIERVQITRVKKAPSSSGIVVFAKGIPLRGICSSWLKRRLKAAPKPRRGRNAA